MQVLVLYYSKTGNTKKLAEKVVKGVQAGTVNCILKSTEEVTKDDFLNSDAIIAGSPVYFGTMSYKLKEIFDTYVSLRKQMENKIGACFTTSGSPVGGNETTIMSIMQAMLIYGMIVVGDPMSATGHYGISCAGSPDDESLSNAEKLGKRVAELVKKIA